MYAAKDILWIKSVTHNGGTDWAYMEYDVGDIFNLHFPNNKNWFPTNYNRPKPNELIAIFQTLISTEQYQGGWYLTHLVSPMEINDTINDGVSRRPYFRPVTVVGRAEPGYLVPNDLWSFYKCNRGQICGIKTIERRMKPDYSLEQKKNYIWSTFNRIDPTIQFLLTNAEDTSIDIELFSVEEGAEREKLKQHKYKERDYSIVKKAKEQARQENRLHCEICSLDFSIRYPNVGDGFIECHHRVPISTGGIRRTRLEDLAMVCANCHRMLHRKYNGKYLSITDLQNLLAP